MAFSAAFQYKIVGDAAYKAKIKALAGATSAFRKATQTAGNTVQKTGMDIGKLSTRLANLRTGFAAMMLTMGLKDIASSSLEFEKAMNAVEGRVSATTEQMILMRQAALDLGHDTKFSAIQAAEAQAVLAQRGYKTQQILNLMPDISTLATAGVLDLSEATDMLTGTLKIFGMGMEHANRVTNVLALTATNTANSMPDLINGLKKAGPLGHAAGVGFEDMTAMLGIMGDKMLRGSDAGTLLMNSFRNLIKTTRDSEKRMMELGITKDAVTDAEGRLVDMVTLLQKFEEAGAGVGDIFEIFQIRGAKAFAVMLQQSPQIRGLIELYNDQSNAAERLAEIMSKGVVRAAFESSSAWKNLRISMGKSMEPMTIRIMQLVDLFSTFALKQPWLQRIVVTFMAITTVLLQMVTIFGVVLASIAGITIAMKFLGIVSLATFGTAALAAGIFLAKLVIILAVVAVLLEALPKMWGDIKDISELFKQWYLAEGYGPIGSPGEVGGQRMSSPLSAMAADPNSVASTNKMVVENVVKGSIEIIDRTSGRVNLSDGGGTIPMNLSPFKDINFAPGGGGP